MTVCYAVCPRKAPIHLPPPALQPFFIYGVKLYIVFNENHTVSIIFKHQSISYLWFILDALHDLAK